MQGISEPTQEEPSHQERIQEEKNQLKNQIDSSSFGQNQSQKEGGLEDITSRIEKLKSSYLEADNPFDEFNFRISKFKPIESIVIKKQDRIVRGQERSSYRNHKGTFLPKNSRILYNFKSPGQVEKERSAFKLVQNFYRTPETTYTQQRRAFVDSSGSGKNSSSQRLKKEMDNLMDHLFNDTSRQPFVKYFSHSPKRITTQRTGLDTFFEDYAGYIQRNKNIGGIFASIEIGNDKSKSIKRKLEQLKQRLNKIPNAKPQPSPPPFSQQKEVINQKTKKTLIKPELANFDFDLSKSSSQKILEDIKQKPSELDEKQQKVNDDSIKKDESNQEDANDKINQEQSEIAGDSREEIRDKDEHMDENMVQSTTPTPGE